MPIQVVIQFESGPEAGRTITLERGQVLTFGRGSKPDVAMDYDVMLAQRHFEVSFLDDGVYIRDMGSPNGTTLNGAAVGEQAALRDKDRIVAGRTGFSVRFDSSPLPSGSGRLRG